MREFLTQRATRQKREKIDEVKALALAQHNLGMHRWEMARDHDLEREIQARFPWVGVDPPTPRAEEGASQSPRSLIAAAARRRSSIASLHSHVSSTSETPEPSVMSEPEPIPTHIPDKHRDMRHPTGLTPAPWIVETFKKDVDEQLLLQRECELFLASEKVERLKDQMLHSTSDVKAALEAFQALPPHQQISPLVKLANAEYNVAKIKHTIFEEPVQGWTRIGKEYRTNPKYNPLQVRTHINARHLPKKVSQPGFYTSKDARWSCPYRFPSPKYKVASVSVSNKIG